MRFVSAILVSMILCLVYSTAHADTASGTTTSSTDTTERFRAQGNLLSADTAQAAIAADPNATPPVIARPATPANDGLDPGLYVTRAAANWDIKIKHRTLRPWRPGGAVKLQFCLEGKHLKVPHPGPQNPVDQRNFDMGSICTKAKNIKFGAQGIKLASEYRKVKHTLLGGGNHVDHTGIAAVLGVLQVQTGNRVSGIYNIGIKHSAKTGRQSDLYGMSFGSGSESGSAVAFDSNTKTLSFSVAAIDILDSDGGKSGTLDAAFVEDPMTRGVITISDLKLLEFIEGQGYRFGPGTLTVSDPDEIFSIEGEFSKYFIDNTTGGESVTSYALLDRLSTSDAPDQERGASPFLKDFVNLNVLGISIPDDRGGIIAGIDLTFMTSTDLVAATEGFTISAKLPATYLVALNSGQEELYEENGEDPTGVGNGDGEGQGIPIWIWLIAIALVLVLVVGLRRRS